MAENTPLYETISNVYNGPSLGLPNRDLFGQGIILPGAAGLPGGQLPSGGSAGALAVTAHGGANSVDVAAGACWIQGDTDVLRQPTYRCFNDATVNLGITPDPTNPRIVRIVGQLNDADFTGVNRNWQLQAIHGTPAGTPVAPAEPASAITLATILVPANAASSAAYTITDARTAALIGGGQVGSTWTRIWDSVDAGVTFPTATITTPTLPQNFRHLLLVWNARTNAAALSANMYTRFNGDTTLGNYNSQFARAAGTSTSNGEQLSTTAGVYMGDCPGATAEAQSVDAGIALFPQYNNPNIRKTFIQIFGTTEAAASGTTQFMEVGVTTGRWAVGAAVTTLTWFLSNGSFNSANDTRFSLYGML